MHMQLFKEILFVTEKVNNYWRKSTNIQFRLFYISEWGSLIH